VEEHFKQETKDYLTTIKRLQEENRKLSASLTAATERDRYYIVMVGAGAASGSASFCRSRIILPDVEPHSKCKRVK
jgi:hypothetical protein